MRTQGAQLACRLAGLLAALALLPACGAGAGDAHTPPSPTPPPSPVPSVADAPPTPAARQVRWIDLKVGDCLAAPPSTDLDVVSQTVTVVDCAAPHQAEVYLLAPVAVDAAITTVADRACDQGFAQYTGRPVAGGPFGVTYLIDSRQDRTANNPDPSTVICLLQTTNGQPLTQSARR